jgi:hypothetical protein
MKIIESKLRQIIKEEVIKGRTLDRYTTALSRKIVNVLKNNQVVDKLHSMNTGEEVELKNPMGLDQIVADLSMVRDVYLILAVNDEGYLDVAGNYVFNTENRDESDFYIVIDLPIEYDDSIFSVLIPELKETLRHELEHSADPTEMLSIPPDDKWSTLKNLEDHFVSEAETKAYITGLYKKAKMLKRPATELIDDYLSNVYNIAQSKGHDDKKLGDVMTRIRDVWRYYLLGRYPHAETEEHEQTEKIIRERTVKDLMLDKETSHGGWPEGPSKSFTSNKPVNVQIAKWLKDMDMIREEDIIEKVLSKLLDKN